MKGNRQPRERRRSQWSPSESSEDGRSSQHAIPCAEGNSLHQKSTHSDGEGSINFSNPYMQSHFPLEAGVGQRSSLRVDDIESCCHRYSLRFYDAAQESLFAASRSLVSHRIFALIMGLAVGYFSVCSLMLVSLSDALVREPILYACGAVVCFLAACSIILHRFFLPKFYRLHFFVHLLLSCIFIFIRFGSLMNMPATENIFLIILLAVVAPGDYWQNLILAALTVATTIIIVALSEESLTFYSVSYSLFIGFSLTALLSRINEVKERRIFIRKKSMESIAFLTFEASQHARKTLANVFPMRAIDDIVRSKGTKLPPYESSTSEIIIVELIDTGNNSIARKQLLNFANAFITVCTVFERHNIHRVKSCGLRILGVVGLFEQEVPCLIPAAVEVGIALRKQLKKSKITATISVARGPCKGGFINTTRKSFDLFGEAVDSCLSCSNACGPLEVCVDGPCMEHFLILRQIEISPLIARKNPRAGSEATWIIPCTVESEIAFCGHPIAEHDEDGENVAEKEDIIGTEDQIEHSPLEASAHEEPKLGSSEDQQINDRIRELQGPAHWGWAIGNFSFPDKELENEYSQYICSEQNLQIMRVLMGVLVANAILSGVVDFGFYYECGIRVNILQHWFLLARYYALVPVLIGVWIFSSQAMQSHAGLKNSQKLSSLLWACCLVYSLYLFIRVMFMYGTLEMTKKLEVWDFLTIYSELGVVAITLIFVNGVIPLQILSTFLLWIIGWTMLFYYHRYNIHLTGGGVIWMWSFSKILSPIAILWLPYLTRCYLSRKDFITLMTFKQFTENYKSEEEVIDNALFCVLSEKIALQLKAGTKHVPDHYEAFPILALRFCWRSEDLIGPEPFQVFDFMSEIFQTLEGLCKLSGLDIVQTFGNYALIAPSNCDSHKNGAGFITSMIERMLRLSQEACLLKFFDRDASNLSCFQVACGIDVGCAIWGLIGAKKFVFDCAGTAVVNAEFACRVAAPSRILVTDNVRKYVQHKTYIEFNRAQSFQGRSGRILLHDACLREDLEAFFLSHVDWVTDVDHPDDCDTFLDSST